MYVYVKYLSLPTNSFKNRQTVKKKKEGPGKTWRFEDSEVLKNIHLLDLDQTSSLNHEPHPVSVRVT